MFLIDVGLSAEFWRTDSNGAGQTCVENSWIQQVFKPQVDPTAPPPSPISLARYCCPVKFGHGRARGSTGSSGAVMLMQSGDGSLRQEGGKKTSDLTTQASPLWLTAGCILCGVNWHVHDAPVTTSVYFRRFRSFQSFQNWLKIVARDGTSPL